MLQCNKHTSIITSLGKNAIVKSLTTVHKLCRDIFVILNITVVSNAGLMILNLTNSAISFPGTLRYSGLEREASKNETA